MILILLKFLVYSASPPSIPLHTNVKDFSDTHEDDKDSDIDSIAHFHLDTNLNSLMVPNGFMT